MRLLLAAGIALTASLAQAQYPSTGVGIGQRQTAMGALGQVGVLNNSPGGMGYRVAARNGVAQQQQRAPGQANKPFSGVAQGPTISPYLNLFRDESQNAAPNYYAFVRPQQEQYEAARAQQAQLQQLQRQVQQTSYRTPATNVAGGARFGDTGRFYNGWRR